MPTQDNSPARGYVRWFDIQLVYKGVIYNIKEGNTNKKYIYWQRNNPTVFQVSEDFPLQDGIILYINNSGGVITYPLQEGVFLNSINSSNGSNSNITEHILNKKYHVNEELLQVINTLGTKLENAILRIEALEKR